MQSFSDSCRPGCERVPFQGLEPTLDLAVALRVVWRCLNGSSGEQHTHLSCFFQGIELRDSLGLGERSPQSDAVGMSVIPTPPAPFVANAKPLKRSKSWWIGGEKHSHEAPVQGLDTRTAKARGILSSTDGFCRRDCPVWCHTKERGRSSRSDSVGSFPIRVSASGSSQRGRVGS